jgi:nicotinamidase/pyrazinamidase
MINRLRNKIDDIHVTLDSHHEVHIAHPIWWINSAGQHPNPFTLISDDDVIKGVWRATNPATQERSLKYVQTLKANKRYVLCIWPSHCIIGTVGATIVEPVSNALKEWCKTRFKKVDYVPKGSNCFTENYSVVMADVIDDNDPTTMLNTNLLKVLADADVIPIAGEALSHCVANSVTDICNAFGEDNIKKFVLLEDCSSNVGGFEQMGKDFVAAMMKRGMKVAKSTEFLG